MEQSKRSVRFLWSDQIDLHARILAGMGTPFGVIANRLGCDRGTVRKHLGKQCDHARLSKSELLDLFEQYDAVKNIAEALTVPSGSTEQARLRASLRARQSAKQDSGQSKFPSRDDFTDEELCADLARLVGRPLQLNRDS